MKTRFLVAVMVTMLVFNFIAWTAFTVDNRNDLKEIRSVIEKCSINE